MLEEVALFKKKQLAGRYGRRTTTMPAPVQLSPTEGLAECGVSREASTDAPSASAIYRHADSSDGFPNRGDARTSYDLFLRATQRFNTERCLGIRPHMLDDGDLDSDAASGSGASCGSPVEAEDFEWLSYAEVSRRVALLASGLAGCVGGQRGVRAVLYGANCPEWMIAMQVRQRGPHIERTAIQQ